jgi:hypothetical protein
MRVEIGKSRANALAEYTRNPMAQAVLTPSAFMESCLGFSQEQIELFSKMRDDEMMEEMEKMKEVKDILEPEEKPKEEEPDKSKEKRGDPVKKREMPSASV